MKKTWKLVAVATVASLGMAACGGSSSSKSSDTTVASSDTTASGSSTLANFTAGAGTTPVNCKPASGPLKAAWIYVGPITDGGWTQAQHEGLKAVQAAFGDKVVTTYKENIPEGPQVATTIDQLVKDGNTVIFGTSFGFQDSLVASAAKYPNVCFEMLTGYKYANNLSEAYGAGEDGDYLAGIAAGYASKTGKVGYVAPFAIPEVLRGVNSFTLGVKKANPNGSVRVTFTSTWFDPTKERQAAESLISAGVDVLSTAQDSPAGGEAAKAAGIPWVGYDSDQSTNFPDNWLTATTYHWGVYEVPRIQQILDGTWVSGDYYGGLDDGFVTMAPFGKLVSQQAKDTIASEMTKLKAAKGSQFTGEIKAQDGTVKVAAGAVASHGDLMGMDYLINGVIGDLPKS